MKEFKKVAGGCSLANSQCWGMECDDDFRADDGERVVIMSKKETHFKMPSKIQIKLRKE